ncbi:MAG: hypothetical protein KF884_05475 [Fimbriimonadaceae bacterium]|nr:hypothetical protein [Fimbriimonadaceae bacterium]QYK59535.1 MAG: hypothetical protein KF884_05475 [Fimbriimonadaceae bacterium]
MVGGKGSETERLVLIAPGTVGTPDSPGILREAGPVTHRLAETGTVGRLTRANPDTAPFEALGLDPRENWMPPGPLWVAGLDCDPPERSVEFCLTLGSISEDGTLRGVRDFPLVSGLEEVFERLRTRVLVPVLGQAGQNGLVWERGSLDLGLTPWSGAVGRHYREVWPEGDGEAALRRLIEDSVELLSALDLNRRRTDEGRVPFNILWPWGGGHRRAVPNLALRRGFPAQVDADDLAIAGLARLVRYGHRRLLGRSPTDLSGPRDRIVVMPAPDPDDLEERLAAWRRLEDELIGPAMVRRAESLLVAVPGLEGGLAVAWPGEGGWPFDERTLVEPKAPVAPLWQWVEQSLAPQT